MKDLMFQPPPQNVLDDHRVFRVLNSSQGSHPLQSPVTDQEVILQICRWVLEMRIKGRSNETLTRTLSERLELPYDEADRLVVMAETAGALAAETTDRQADPSDAVAGLEAEGVDHDFAVELINACINMFHDIVEEADRGDSLALGIDLKSAEAYFAAADYVLDCLNAGRSHEETAKKLVEKEIFLVESAAGFIDEVVLARAAAERIAAGEEGTQVFEDLDLHNRSPYVMLLALRLKK